MPLVLTLELIKISLMHVQEQEGDKKVIDYDDLDNSKAVRNIWGQWGLVPTPPVDLYCFFEISIWAFISN